MERFKDERIGIYKFYDSVDVKCPNCGKKAAVKIKEGIEKCPNCGGTDCSNRRVFECNHCYHILNGKKIMYEPYAKVYCSNCTEKYEVTSKISSKKLTTLKVTCPYCDHQEVVKSKLKEVEVPSKKVTDAIIDPFYDCALWYQERIKEHVFWALNQDHLAYLERYIAADLRERSSNVYGRMTMIAKLPNFIKEAKNRGRLLKIIQKWKK